MNEYDLDNLINLAYEYYYIKKTDRCIDIVDISIEDSKILSNIKIIPAPDKINSYVNQIFNTDINFIGKFKSDYVFNRIGPLNTTITIRQYINSDEIDDIDSEENKHKQISFLLSDLVTKKKN